MTVGKAFNVYNGLAPEQGPKAAGYSAVFTAAVVSIDIDLLQEQSSGDLTFVQTIFVDNRLNPRSVTFLFDGTRQLVSVPPNSQAYLPILAQTPTKITIASQGTAQVDFQLINVPMPALVWQAGN